MLTSNRLLLAILGLTHSLEVRAHAKALLIHDEADKLCAEDHLKFEASDENEEAERVLRMRNPYIVGRKAADGE